MSKTDRKAHVNSSVQSECKSQVTYV